MGIFSGLFTGTVSEIIKTTSEAVDSLITSDEERLAIQLKLKELETNAALKELELESVFEAEITKRWEADAKSESFLPQNIRPLTLVYLLIVITILAFFDGNVGTFKINPAYISLFEALTITAVGGYFTLRSVDKFTKNKSVK